MNFLEGMRRIGIALGVIGAIVGAGLGLLLYSSLRDQHLRYVKFDALLSGKAVKELIGSGWVSGHAGPAASDFIVDNLQEVNRDGIKSIYFDDIGPSGLRRESIEWIETLTGDRVYKAEDPALIQYLAVLACPILGFVLPWGFVRTLAWIGGGFASRKS